ncbi:MAG: hypothetical protein KJP14_06400, partial [Eudoraea sp.]|nr:hypothetical protein [Eudoraea sp.]
TVGRGTVKQLLQTFEGFRLTAHWGISRVTDKVKTVLQFFIGKFRSLSRLFVLRFIGSTPYY